MRSVFEGGPDSHSMDLGFGPDPKPAELDNQEPVAPAGQIVMTQEQFQQLLGQLGQKHQERDYAAALTGKAPEPIPEIDLNQLPDPRTDFDAFKTSLATSLNQSRAQVLQQAAAEVETSRQRQDTIDRAWELLRERHPEVAQHEELIDLASQREIADLSSRGIDPIAALASNMEMAVDRIAERASASLSRIRGVSPDADQGSDRTEMITGRTTRSPQRSAEQPSNFVDELKKIQRELSIY